MVEELGIPEHIHQIYLNVIEPLIKEDTSPRGVTKEAIEARYFKVYNKPLNQWFYRSELIPASLAAGLIEREVDGSDARRWRYYDANRPKEKVIDIPDKLDSIRDLFKQDIKDDYSKLLKERVVTKRIGGTQQ